MNWVIYVDVAVGFTLAAAVLIAAVVAGREAPRHRAIWIVGMALLALRALFSVAIGVGVLLASDGTWAFALGALALLLLIPTAYLRPRWAGITLIVTAVVQPALLVALSPLGGEGEAFPVEVMLGFYSLTAAIIGGVLIAATLAWGHPRESTEAVPAEESIVRESPEAAERPR